MLVFLGSVPQYLYDVNKLETFMLWQGLTIHPLPSGSSITKYFSLQEINLDVEDQQIKDS